MPLLITSWLDATYRLGIDNYTKDFSTLISPGSAVKLAWQNVYECAEVDDTLNLAHVDLADLGFSGDAQNALTRCFCCFFGFAGLDISGQQVAGVRANCQRAAGEPPQGAGV